jgi:hypothetical protein
MDHSWGPIEKAVEHDVKPIAGQGGEGAVTEPHPNSPHNSAPGRSENYDATDGRHNKADHQGWESVDPKSGSGVDNDSWQSNARFPDGPGPWRQT